METLEEFMPSEIEGGVSLWFCQPLDSSNRAMLTPAPEGPSPLNVGPR